MSTICSAFWKHTNIRPGGRIYPCCRFKTPVGISDGNIDDILDSDVYKMLRARVLNGEEIVGCEKCYYEESIGHKSLREEFNEKYSTDTVGLEYLEIGIDNLCNLVCDGCNSEFSTSWRAKEIREQGSAKYDYLTVDTITSVPNTVRKILFLGGEPLITKRHLEVLKLVEDPSKVEIVYNTNAMYIPDVEAETVWSNFKSVQFIISVDGVEDVAERVRGGTVWSKVKQFVEYAYSNYTLEFNTVLHVNNYYDISNIAEYISNYDVDWYVNVLTYPKHLDINNLKEDQKQNLIDDVLFYNIPNKDFIINHLGTN